MASKDKEELIAAVQEHLQGWNDLSERVRKQVVPIVEAQREISQSIMEAQERMRKALEPYFTQQEVLRERLESINLPLIDLPQLPEAVKRAAELQKSIADSLAPVLDHLRETYEELPPRTQKALLILGENGWYLDLHIDMPFLWSLVEAFAKGSQEEAEVLLAEHFEERSEEIEKDIARRFPERGELIGAAFAAHRRGEYVLSIPVLLAQADGICKEASGQNFFLKRDRKPLTAAYVEQFTADTFTAALLSPLATALPIAASERERGENFSALNRHMVMHGESLDYGTRLNGLKAISLVNYVSQVLERENQDVGDGAENI